MNINIEWLAHAPLQKLFSFLSQHNVPAWCVGGCIRNSLLGREIHDVDLAVDADIADLADLFQKAGYHVVTMGIEFGSIQVIIDHIPFDLTCLRRDIRTDGRHAVVTRTHSLYEDVYRRDFTINALYMDKQGQIYDPLEQGIKDCHDKMLRIVGEADKRLQEDYLRILRFFRFWACYDLNPDEQSLQACKRQIAGLIYLSMPRIYSELQKIFALSDILPVLAVMHDIGLWQHLPYPLQYDAMFLQRYHELLMQWQCFMPVSYWAVLLQDAHENWPLQRREKKMIMAIQKIAMQLRILMQAQDANGIYAIAPEYEQKIFWQGVALFCAQDGSVFFVEQIKKLRSFPEWPVFPLSGRDLLAAKCNNDGKAIGEVMRLLKQHWIDSRYLLSRQELLRLCIHKNI